MSLPYPITNHYGETVSPTGYIRERVAASIYAGKPSGYELSRHFDVRLSDPVGFFLYGFKEQERNNFAQEWADNLLVALDKMGLAIIETNEVA
jgi:hypothetical protein